MSPRRKRWLLILAAAAIVAAIVVWPTIQTTALLLDLADWRSFPRGLLPARAVETRATMFTIPTRHGPVAARLDEPVTGARRTLVVFPGVHAAGLDEPRLTRFSERLAATGLNVLSVPLPDLRVFRLTGRSTDIAEDAAGWAAGNARLAADRRVGVVGISFAGGLAVVAAGRPSLADRITAVVSLGGHGDLERVLEYLCTGTLPDGTRLPPHEYSLGVVLLAAVPYLVPPDEVAALERVVERYLYASTDESPDFARGRPIVADIERLANAAPDATRRVIRWMLARDVVAGGRAIRPFIGDLARDPALSPERSPAPNVPVFLLHGRDDNVIPATETPRLAEYLQSHRTPEVQWLLTPILSHIGIDRSPAVLDVWRLVRFWRALDDRVTR
jgi:dienelactone hydrolase